MPTPVDPDRLEHHLKRINYDPEKTKFLVDGFRYGFKIRHEGSLTEEEPANDQSITDYPQAAREKIEGEVGEKKSDLFRSASDGRAKRLVANK